MPSGRIKGLRRARKNIRWRAARVCYGCRKFISNDRKDHYCLKCRNKVRNNRKHQEVESHPKYRGGMLAELLEAFYS